MRVRVLEDEVTHDVAAVEVDTGDVAQALALVSRCEEQGVPLPPVLVVLDGPHRRAALRPLLQDADVEPGRLLIGSRVGGLYDGAGRRRHLPPVQAGRWVDESRLETALAAGRRRGRTWIWLAGAAAVVVAAVAVAWVAGLLPGGGGDDAPPTATAPARPLTRPEVTFTASDVGRARPVLRQAAATGAQRVVVVVPRYLDRRDGTSIRAVDGRTPTDRTLRRIVRLAHGMGLAVTIRPQVDSLGGALDVDDVGAFARAYRAFVAHYADLAIATGAEALSAGTELEGSIQPLAHDVRVAKLVKEVRARAAGG